MDICKGRVVEVEMELRMVRIINESDERHGAESCVRKGEERTGKEWMLRGRPRETDTLGRLL